MTIQQQPTPYAVLPLDLSNLLPFDAVHGMSLPGTGDIQVMFYNPTASAKHFTVASTPNAYGRTDDIANYSLASKHFAVLQYFPAFGWAAAGEIAIAAADVDTRNVADGVSTLGGTHITSATIAYTEDDLGAIITDSTAGVAGGLYTGVITGIVSATDVTVDPPTPSAGTGQTVTIDNPLRYLALQRAPGT